MSARRALGLALLAVACAARGEPLALDALMQRLAANGATATAFVETRESAALRRPLVASGELRYQPPATLERLVRAPVEERYLVVGDRVTVTRKGGDTFTLSLAAQPALAAFLESLRATLRGDAATLRRFYRVEAEGTLAAWELTLLPRDPAVAELVSVVRMRGAEGRLARMEVREASGDRVVTEFSPPRAPEARPEPRPPGPRPSRE